MTTIRFEELIQLFHQSYAVDFDGQLLFVSLEERDGGETYEISLEDGIYTISKKDNEEVEVLYGDTYVLNTELDGEEDEIEVTFLTSMKR